MRGERFDRARAADSRSDEEIILAVLPESAELKDCIYQAAVAEGWLERRGKATPLPSSGTVDVLRLAAESTKRARAELRKNFS